MAFLFICPTLAFAKVVPDSAFVKLKKPALLRPAATGAGQPYTFGPYVLPVTPDGRVVAVNPNLPDYLKRLNCGIPGYTGPGQPAQCWSILNYKKDDPNAAADAENMAGGSPMGGGGFPGLGGGGGAGGPGAGGDANGNPYAGGSSPYQTASLGDPNTGYGYGSSGPTITGKGLVEGLCTMDNKNHTQYQSGYCKTIQEALEAPCMQNIMRSVAGNARIGGMENFCSSYNQFPPSIQMQFWTQLVAALVQEESSWVPNKPPSDGGRSKGLLQLSEGDSRYGCHCEGLNAQNIWDPHKNLKCGAVVVMTNIRKDMEMGRGPAGYAGARGAARYFGPFGDKQAHKRSRIAQKTQNYCVARANNGGGSTAVAEAASAVGN